MTYSPEALDRISVLDLAHHAGISLHTNEGERRVAAVKTKVRRAITEGLFNGPDLDAAVLTLADQLIGPYDDQAVADFAALRAHRYINTAEAATAGDLVEGIRYGLYALYESLIHTALDLARTTELARSNA